jgi:hypothetical protein
VVYKDWKLIAYSKEPAHYELYNLRFDPHEVKNVIDEEPDMKKVLLEALENIRLRNKENQIPADSSNDDKSLNKEDYKKILDNLKTLGY